MPEKKPTIVGLQALVAELIATKKGLEEVNYSSGLQIGALKKQLEQQANNFGSEISTLRDELHRMTVENARLEGYRDRVLEFDPVTERQQFQEERDVEFRHREHFGTPPQTIRERRIGRYGVMAADTYGEHRTPWYQRRG